MLILPREGVYVVGGLWADVAAHLSYNWPIHGTVNAMVKRSPATDTKVYRLFSLHRLGCLAELEFLVPQSL